MRHCLENPPENSLADRVFEKVYCTLSVASAHAPAGLFLDSSHTHQPPVIVPASSWVGSSLKKRVLSVPRENNHHEAIIRTYIPKILAREIHELIV